MNTNSKKRQGKVTLLSFLLLISLCVISLASCAQAKDSSLPLSPALNCIAQQNNMAKSTLKGSSVSFCADDFARATNLNNIEKITLTSVPPISDGQLCIGSTVLNSGHVLSRASLDLMTYTPTSNISSSEFRFKINDEPYEMCCKLYVLEKQNYAPTLSSAQMATQVSTYKNVTLYGTLPCYDPDGDTTYIEIVSYPEKGVLIMDDNTIGTYRFIPYEDSVGKDEFTYVARDMYGNYSASATVSLKINKQETPVSYVDLVESPYHNAALAMTEKGIMSGTQVGNYTYFYPSTTVSRAEFTVMAMNAMGIKEVAPTSATVFSDEADIPSQMRDYIATAYELGYIKGIEKDNILCFEPNRAITRAEAAVMLSNMIDAATPTFKPSFDDSADIPTWAEASVNSMNYMGVLSIDSENNISPTSAVTRGDAAEMLNKFMALPKN